MLHIQLMALNKQAALRDNTEAETVRVFINSLGHEARCRLCKFAETLNYIDRHAG